MLGRAGGGRPSSNASGQIGYLRRRGGGSGREREGEEKTGEQHEGNAGKDEAERAARSAEEARHL